MDAIEVLRSDHRRADGLLGEFSRADPLDVSLKRNVAAHLLGLLDVHIQLEEELFFPALLEEPAKEALVRDERSGHAEILRLVQRLKDLSAEDPDYDPTFRALGVEALKHFRGEEMRLFPLARHLGEKRLGQLGEKLLARREALASPYV